MVEELKKLTYTRQKGKTQNRVLTSKSSIGICVKYCLSASLAFVCIQYWILLNAALFSRFSKEILLLTTLCVKQFSKNFRQHAFVSTGGQQVLQLWAMWEPPVRDKQGIKTSHPEPCFRTYNLQIWRVTWQHMSVVLAGFRRKPSY